MALRAGAVTGRIVLIGGIASPRRHARHPGPASGRPECKPCAGHDNLWGLLKLASHHLLEPAPALECRPDAALELKTVDRRRRMNGADAVETDAGPLEAA